MFELVDEDTIRYIGGAEKWKEEFVAGLRNKVKPLLPTLYRIGLARSISLKNT